MANTISAFFENLVAATSGFNRAVVGETSFLDGVYTAVQPEVAGRDAKTITIPFPDFGSFTDWGSTDPTFTDVAPSSVVLDFVNHPGAGTVIRDLEEWQTGVDIREKFLDPMYMRAAEYLNSQLAGLITAANFNVNPVIAGATAAAVSTTEIVNAWDLLADQKVPLGNIEDLNLFVHNNVKRRMLTDTNFTQESMVGINAAEASRQKASLRPAFGFNIRHDQQAPKQTITITGTVAVTNGSATVTGTGTNFTSANTGSTTILGTNILMAGDPTRTQYRVIAVASATSLTIGAVYAGATNASTGVSAYLYTTVAMHRYAIALGLRPLPPPDTNTIHYQPIMYRGIPMRVMSSYQHLKLGWVTTVDFGFGVKVIRPAFGVLITV